MVRRFRTSKKAVLIARESHAKPGYRSREYRHMYRNAKDADRIQFCQYSPILGIIPIEISDVYPAAHHESARIDVDPVQCTEFAKTWDTFFENNGFAEIRYDKGDKFLDYFAKRLEGIRREAL